MTTGEKIKAIRKQRNMTQYELAEKTGLNLSTISHIENNLSKHVRNDTLEVFSDVLGVPVKDLIGDIPVNMTDVLKGIETQLKRIADNMERKDEQARENHAGSQTGHTVQGNR